MQYFKRGKSLDPKKHNVGKSPKMTVLNNARSNMLHHTTYNRQRELLNYAGCPETRYNDSLSISGNYDCSFYIIYPVRGITGDKIRVGFNMTTWKNYDSSANCNFKWDGVTAPNLTSKEVVASTAQSVSYNSTGSTIRPLGITVTDNIELDYNHNSFGTSNNYGYTKVSFEHLIPATFVSWIMPQYVYDYSAIDPSFGSQSFNMPDSAFNIDQTLRGSSSNDDSNGSVGTLCQRQFDDGTLAQNMVSNSDLCMFQWGHPAGLYIVGGSATITTEDVFGYTIKIKGRELLANDTGSLDVCLVFRADAGTAIKMNVGSTGSNYVDNLTTTTGTTPTTEVVFSGITFDGSGDDLTFTCEVSDSQAIEIKSIAIFEQTY